MSKSKTQDGIKIKADRYSAIMRAMKQMEKAMLLPEPEIAINIQWGMNPDDPRAKEFVDAVKNLIAVYEKLFGEKPRVSLYFA